MVRALEGPPDLTRVLGADLRAAVPADVEEGAQLPVPAADHQDALPADLDLAECT